VANSSGKRLWFGNSASHGLLSLPKKISLDNESRASKTQTSNVKPVVSVTPVCLAKVRTTEPSKPQV